jgi:hypothetical protein
MAAIIATAAAWLASIKAATWVVIASTAYQIAQAKKMRKAAREAAEARKGFEVVVEGEAQAIPIVYGRARIGGVRVWHNTKSTNDVPTGYVTNADKSFDLSGGFVQATTYIYSALFAGYEQVATLPETGTLGVIYQVLGFPDRIWNGTTYTSTFTLNGNDIIFQKEIPSLESGSLSEPQSGGEAADDGGLDGTAGSGNDGGDGDNP